MTRRAARPSFRLLYSIAAVAVLGSALAASTHATAAHVSSIPHSCPTGNTYTIIKMNPKPLATFGSLQANQTVSFNVMPLNGSSCVAGATVYMYTNKNAAGDSVNVLQPSACGGATHITSNIIACTTDSTGKISFSYTTPSSIQANGVVEITAQKGSSVSQAIIAEHDWYLYEMVYRFSASPIAPGGSLPSGKTVSETLTAVGPDGSPQQNLPVFLSLTSTATHGGSAAVGSTALGSTGKRFLTNASGQIAFTYTAPATLPSSGVDTIRASSSSSQTGAVFNATQYSFASSTPTISVGDVTQTEGDGAGPAEKGTFAEFDVSLSKPQASTVTVQYITVCGVGDKGCKEDYLQTLMPTPRSVSIPAGQVSAHIGVILYSYVATEPYLENFYVQLLNPSGAVLGRSLGTGNLLADDEAATHNILYLGDTGVVRSLSGTQFAEFTVTLSLPTSSSVSFAYATVPGSAAPGVDFTPEAGQATIAANTTSTHIEVPILASTSAGAPLTYQVTISAPPSGYTIERGTGTGTIYSAS